MKKMIFNIPIPSIFVCFLIFILWMHYEKRKTDKKQTQQSQEFWQREEEANHTRNKDFSDLPMFVPERDSIPMPETTDENARYYKNKVLECLELPMMNLSQYTNTDLKLAYGVGNFKTLSNFDDNFNKLLMNLSNLGNAYSGLKGLAAAYAAMGSYSRIDDLIAEAERSELPRKSNLTAHLRDIRNAGSS